MRGSKSERVSRTGKRRIRLVFIWGLPDDKPPYPGAFSFCSYPAISSAHAKVGPVDSLSQSGEAPAHFPSRRHARMGTTGTTSLCRPLSRRRKIAGR